MMKPQNNSYKDMKLFFITVGLTLFWLLSVWTENSQEFSNADSIGLFLHVAIVLLVEFSIYTIFIFGVKKKYLPAILNAAFCVFNLYTLLLVHFESIDSLGMIQNVLFILLLIICFYIFFHLIGSGRLSQNLIYLLIMVFILQAGGSYYFRENAEAEVLTVPPRYLSQKFSYKPNVYIIFFDALIPEAIAKKFLDIDRLEYASVLRKEGFRILKNTFADRVPTHKSINSFVTLELGYYNRVGKDIPGKYKFVTGEKPSPLYEVFKNNDYKVQLLYKSSYFGPKSKSNLDYYGTALEKGICTHIDNDFSFMGYCLPMLEGIGGVEYPEYVFERIKETSKMQSNWLTISYIYHPGHTEKKYKPSREVDYKEYREQFVVNEKKAAGYIQQLIDIIKMNDPDSVIAIFGDHGAYLSRGLSRSKFNNSREMTPNGVFLDHKFVFQDRHAVIAAIYPEDFCNDELNIEPIGLISIGRGIIKCLSGGKGPDKPWRPTDDDAFDDYLYE